MLLCGCYFFFAGAFVSSLITLITGRNQRFSYLLPVLIEISILLFSCFYGDRYDGSLLSKELYAGSLLFAMGLQNALVSMISGSVVRTTHLTCMFTDLGIELAQILGRNVHERLFIISKIKLRLVIIFFFMAGAIAGAYAFNRFGFQSFLVPSLTLFFALIYDALRIRATRYYRSKAIAMNRGAKKR